MVEYFVTCMWRMECQTMFRHCWNLLIYRKSDVQHNGDTIYLLVQVVFPTAHVRLKFDELFDKFSCWESILFYFFLNYFQLLAFSLIWLDKLFPVGLDGLVPTWAQIYCKYSCLWFFVCFLKWLIQISWILSLSLVYYCWFVGFDKYKNAITYWFVKFHCLGIWYCTAVVTFTWAIGNH
jgi:hypothetical protein